MTDRVIGIIGGSGLYRIDGLSDVAWRRVESPFGPTSDEFCFGTLDGQPVVFLPRHGRGHVLPPSAINFRANIDALKRCGVDRHRLAYRRSAACARISRPAISSLSISSSTAPSPATRAFSGQAASRMFRWRIRFAAASATRSPPPRQRSVSPVKRGGTYLVIEGPQFSTLAESELYRSWRCDVIGMTNMPEAKLAREAEICYATVAMVTDYDCWHPGHEAVTVEMILSVLDANAETRSRAGARGRAACWRAIPGHAGRDATARSTRR